MTPFDRLSASLPESHDGPIGVIDSADLRAVLDLVAASHPRLYPVTWRDDGQVRNAWSRNGFTGEIQPDPEGEPLFTTPPPTTEED